MTKDQFYDKVVKLARPGPESGWKGFKFYVEAFDLEYMLIKKPIDCVSGAFVWVCGESGLIGTADVHGITYDNMWVGYNEGIVYKILDVLEATAKMNDQNLEAVLDTIKIDGWKE